MPNCSGYPVSFYLVHAYGAILAGLVANHTDYNPLHNNHELTTAGSKMIYNFDPVKIDHNTTARPTGNIFHLVCLKGYLQ